MGNSECIVKVTKTLLCYVNDLYLKELKMAKSQSITIPVHHNIYNGSAGRDLRIDFSNPDSGVTAETGLIILVPGFGANIEFNVYKKCAMYLQINLT